MAKLNCVINRDPFAPQIERWEVNGGIIADVVYDQKTASITFSDITGDITDQIYDRLKEQNSFVGLDLKCLESFYLKIPKEILTDLLFFVDCMDKVGLKGGREY